AARREVAGDASPKESASPRHHDPRHLDLDRHSAERHAGGRTHQDDLRSPAYLLFHPCKMQGSRDRGGHLIAVRGDDIDDLFARETTALDEMGKRERAGLMRDDDIDAVAIPVRTGKKMVDKIGKFARCQLEQFTPVHLKETTRREPLGLPVEINSRAAGGELAGLIALMMGFKTAGTN